MANPNAFTYTAAGARTVQAKGDWADKIVRLDIEDLQMLARIPRASTHDTNPRILEDNLQAIDLTNYHAEGAVAPAAVTVARTINQNMIQILKKTATVSNVQNAIAQYGMGKEYDYQKALRILEIARDVEAFTLSDQAMQASTPANLRVGRMAGMSALIVTNTNLVANFNKANFDLLYLATVGTSAGNPMDVWVGGAQKGAIAAWAPQVTRFTQDTKTLYDEVQVYNGPYGGLMRVHWHKHMPQNVVGLGAVALALDLRPNIWQYKQLIPLERTELGATGAGPSCQIMWGITLLCGGEQANFGFLG